ncbi:hypothetical protein EG68_12544 [Paragonimus skrjabini miyazakii]|uniref:Uncharacterized protein n=1 Tax=Paragonimus skrjabini miyazakii TaxID=59628 RepID=A0A8S9YG35_9TREM|nr:hypothetical protein EG68_12544 [Paragonimus skrjabini miyazakii]
MRFGLFQKFQYYSDITHFRIRTNNDKQRFSASIHVY